jgi:DNA-binding GntR family transcriptional regulator
VEGPSPSAQGPERLSVEAAHPLDRRSSGEMVADHLRRAIFSGRYGPGAKLPQEEIASELGVSRIPVREALVILEAEGRVRMELHRGAFVIGMDAESVRDNAELFGMIYGFLARRTAERADDDTKVTLAQIAETMAVAERPGDVWRTAEHYLDLIIVAGAAPRLAPVIRRMRSLAVANLFDVVPEAVDNTRDGTLRMIEAILAGDGARAAEIQAEAQRRGAELVIAEFTRRGTITPEDT